MATAMVTLPCRHPVFIRTVWCGVAAKFWCVQLLFSDDGKPDSEDTNSLSYRKVLVELL